MTWKSHRIITFFTVFAFTHNPVAALCSMAGSTFPDRIEGMFWRHWHRKYSHWFVFYLPCLLLHGDTVSDCLFWFFVGALLHILEDAVCGKIPFFSPRKRIWVLPRLFYTGSAGEYTFVVLYSVLVFTVIR